MKKFKILARVMLVMMMVLSMREIEADLAENGKLAVEMFAAHEPGYYDAILMDMRMPEMDGLEATMEIRKTDSKVPIIALTANAFDSDKQKALEAGCNNYMAKPIVAAELLQLMIKYLGE